MRLRSHIWISAFLRREMADGAYSAVLRKGSEEAGAIYVVHAHGEGRCSVWAPAPQTVFGDEVNPYERRFEKVKEDIPEAEARDWLDRQVSFDPDCWIVETERRGGEPDLL